MALLTAAHRRRVAVHRNTFFKKSVRRVHTVLVSATLFATAVIEHFCVFATAKDAIRRLVAVLHHAGFELTPRSNTALLFAESFVNARSEDVLGTLVASVFAVRGLRRGSC